MSEPIYDLNVVDLHIETAGGAGSRAALETALRDAIRSGRLSPSSALPSTRALAADLGISRSTVVAAYEQLGAEGYLHAAHGSGTTVAPRQPRPDPIPEVDPFGPTPTYDFRPGEPDPSSFPRARWMRSVRRAVSESPDAAFGYPDPRGVPELRSTIADHLARTRAVAADSSAVHIVGGYGAGLGFLGETLRRRGVSRVAVEDPMFPFHVQALRRTGIETVRVPVDPEGLDVDALRDARVDAAVVTPAHQYPTAVTMTAERRTDILGWANETDAWIIEDDYDGEFRYDRRPIGSLQGLGPERVIYAGTASKSLSPALRIGWLIVPYELRGDLLRTLNVRAGVSSLDQLALADFVARGELDRHVRAMRSVYARRNSLLRSVLAESAPWLDVAPGAAGLHLAAGLRSAHLDESAVLAAADAASVGLLGMATHHASPTAGPGLAIGFSRPPEHLFPAALDRLGDVLSGL